MKSLIFALVVALTSLSAAAENNISFIVTPSSVLPPGKYYWIHVENGVPVVTEIITRSLPNTPNPDPNPDPKPNPQPVDKQLADLLSKVVGDTDKKVTAGKIAGLCDLLLAQVEAGTVADVAVLRKDVGAIVPVLTLMGKSTAWKPFSDGVITLLANADFATSVTILKAVSDALKKV